MESKPTVKQLVAKSSADVVSFLGGIYEHSAWVAEELVKREDVRTSLETVSQLAAAMKAIVDNASKERKMELLCAHPDLCEKVGVLEQLTKESQEEQSRSGLQSLTIEELDNFNTWNTAYREKCGFPFILAVRNATKLTVLAALEGRVKNPPEVEFATALEQVHKIAWMRLLSKLDVSDAKGFLTCHVLDTANGCPAQKMRIQLHRLSPPESAGLVGEFITNDDGRLEGGPALKGGSEFTVGIYEWTFFAGDYFASKGSFTPGQPFLDVIPLRFGIDNPDDHYHVPLLVSPWSFSTYRGTSNLGCNLKSYGVPRIRIRPKQRARRSSDEILRSTQSLWNADNGTWSRSSPGSFVRFSGGALKISFTFRALGYATEGMRRRQHPPPQAEDALPQTIQAAEDMADGKRRRKGPKLFQWSRIMRFFAGQNELVKVVSIALSFVAIVFYVRRTMNPSLPNRSSDLSSRNWTPFATTISGTLDLVLPSTMVSKGSMLFPSVVLGKGKLERDPYYGGLDLRFLESDDGIRVIYHDGFVDEGKIVIGKGDDDVEYYYAFDDDVKRNPYIGWNDHSLQHRKHCRRTSWHRDLYLNCNTFHEFGLLDTFLEGESKYLGEGSYRQVLKSELETEKVIFKVCNWDSTGRKTFSYEDYEFMRMDMVVAEIFSSNPYFVDIYGFCGLSMFSEFMPYGDLEKYATPKYRRGKELSFLNETADVQPQNDFNPSEKLAISLQMAEAVAFMHNYHRGVIIHDDIQLPQFLMTSDGKHGGFNSSDLIVKLNDFNRAEIMLFDEKHNEYCRYRNGPGQGDWRAPEEYFDKPLNEKIDVWSLGCNMYSLLTGLVPFYDLKRNAQVREKLKAGQRASLDPRYRTRSYAEGKIAEAIDLCWKHEPHKRTDIGKLVKLLRDAVEENNRLMKEVPANKAEA